METERLSYESLVGGMLTKEEYASYKAKYEMCLTGNNFHAGDGILADGVENTIKNVGRLGRVGMRDTDREIMKIVTGN